MDLSRSNLKNPREVGIDRKVWSSTMNSSKSAKSARRERERRKEECTGKIDIRSDSPSVAEPLSSDSFIDSLVGDNLLSCE